MAQKSKKIGHHHHPMTSGGRRGAMSDTWAVMELHIFLLWVIPIKVARLRQVQSSMMSNPGLALSLTLNCTLEDGLRKGVVAGYMTVPREVTPLHNPEQWFLSACKGKIGHSDLNTISP